MGAVVSLIFQWEYDQTTALYRDLMQRTYTIWIYVYQTLIGMWLTCIMFLVNTLPIAMDQPQSRWKEFFVLLCQVLTCLDIATFLVAVYIRRCMVKWSLFQVWFVDKMFDNRHTFYL